MTARGDQRRLRSRRRRRRVVRGAIRTVFWTLVLAGVFILGIGYGRTLSGEDELREDEVTITQPRDAIEATLPTRTVTVTKTVRAPRATTRGSGTARNATNTQRG
jgi:hypothetical protein